jgi:uncharacterized protein (DUF885 family)
MINKISALLILFVLISQSITATDTIEDSKFETLANKYIAELIEMNPEWATSLGEHKYDGRLNDYSLKAVKKEREFTEKYLKELNKINAGKLSMVNNVDYRILKHNLDYNIFQIDVLKNYEWNPMSYNVGGAINDLISRDFAPLKDRLMSAKSRLEQVPNVVAAAKLNLKNPPKIYTETAIAQNKGTINLIKGDLQMFIDEAGMKSELAPAQAKAIAALEDFGTWMEKDLLPRSNADFRLGDAKFRQKLKFALQSDYTKEQILERGMADLKATQQKMFDIAFPLYKKFNPNIDYSTVRLDPKAVIKFVLNKLAEDRPNNETIVSQANQDLKEATEFVREKKLVTVPTEPVKVIEMPEFARGTAVAYFDSAGPLEKKNETFFTISPTPKDWSDTRKESFYKEYNDYMLENLTVHEAMPGHYLQIMHSNKFKAPTLVRSLFRSGTFTEGWAVYSEQVMANADFGGDKVEMQQLKMKLRVIINAIIDQKIHTAGMTEREAIDFMMNEGFQEEGEAAGKWKRAQLSSTQLSTYYVGSVEVNDIANAYKAKYKDKVNMLEMHDKMLSYGSPAPKYVKEMLGLN